MTRSVRGWQIRCPMCGRTRDAAEAGLLRWGAYSIGKRILGWCNHCRRPRFIVVECKSELEARPDS